MKLLFVCNNMHIGGVQKALANLLGEISSKHDVSLLLFYPEGELLKSVPENVKVISGNKLTRILGMSQQEAKMSGAITMLWRSAWAVLTKIFGIGFSFAVLSRLQRLTDEYDAAISYMQNSAFKMFYGGCNEFVINSVSAKKRISFVHCDFKKYFGNNKYNRNYYKHFDKIACVSDSCKAIFDSVCPQHAGKTLSVHNCYDFSDMEKKSREYEAEYTEGVVNLFTAARISEEKGIFRVFPALADIKKKGGKFIWRIAGGGPLLKDAIDECNRLGLGDCVKLLGMVDNPYPYFAKSDLLLVPSYNEAAPMVYGEAEFFGLPVFTTNTTSATEMVKNKGIGIVCENTDEAIKSGIEALILNSDNMPKRFKVEFSNDTALAEFKNLIA